jgi:hypothetical protein
LVSRVSEHDPMTNVAARHEATIAHELHGVHHEQAAGICKPRVHRSQRLGVVRQFAMEVAARG